MKLATVLSGTLRSLHLSLSDEPGPICHNCGSGSLFGEVVDQPVYNERERKLHQFHCAVCNTIIEELR